MLELLPHSFKKRTKSENLSIEPPIVGFKDFKTFVHFKKSNQVFNTSAVQSILVFS